MVLNPKFPIMGLNSLTYSENVISYLYDVNTVIQKEHSVNIGYHNAIYNNYFDSVMKYSACPEAVALNPNVTLSDCEIFAKGII